MRGETPQHNQGPEAQPPAGLPPETQRAMDRLARRMPPESVPVENPRDQEDEGSKVTTASEVTRMNLAATGLPKFSESGENAVVSREQVSEAVRQQLIELQKSAQAIAEVALREGVELDSLSKAAIRDTRLTLEALDSPK